jgi:transposase
VYKLQTYLKVRQAYNVESKSKRQISRDLGVNRRTIEKMLENSSPPGYERQKEIISPVIDPHKEWIDKILEADKKIHRKQRHTATRIYHRLQEEHDYIGSYTTVRSYVAKKQLKSKEMFVPLFHDPGMAQCDFGEARATIGGKLRKIHFLVMQLPFCDAMFVKAYLVENTEAFCDGHASAFEFFGGVCLRILYDNTSIIVKKILGNGKREQTDAFIALKSHYLFTQGFANVASGNFKGGVENLVGYARRNLMVPMPEVATIEELNEHLLKGCIKRNEKIVRGHSQTVGQRLAGEKFLPLPAAPYESCRVQSGKINSQGLVRFCDNDYSVPTSVGQQKVWVKGYVDRVVIAFENNVIAQHQRCYDKEQLVLNPLHYLNLLEYKVRAFDQAAALKDWKLPPIFEQVRYTLCRKDPKDGMRSYVRVLQMMMTYSLDEVKKALEQAVTSNIVDESAIRHILQRQLEKLPLNLSMIDHPTVPVVKVQEPDLRVYAQLCTVRAA